MDVKNKRDIKLGMLVEILPPKNKGQETIIRGYVAKILSQANNKKGVKVQLQTGEIGHVDHIITKDELRLENFKFYNQFFFQKELYTICEKRTNSFVVFEHYNHALQRIEKTALLFDSKEMANHSIRGTKYDSKEYHIRPIHRRKPLVDLFSKTDAEFFRINANRKLSKEKLQEWEHYFKNMR